jgi:hypothetical protein
MQRPLSFEHALQTGLLSLGLALAGCGNEEDPVDQFMGNIGDGFAADGSLAGDGAADGSLAGDGAADGSLAGDGAADGSGDGFADGDDPADGDADGSPDGEGSDFPAVTDFAEEGPFSTTQEAGANACTIFRPDPLGEGGLKHPVILWGNGTTASPPVYAATLQHWASHGFIVAAANTSNAGSGKEMLDCLAYLTEQNDASGSAYAGTVDLERVGASGHSQGGAGTIMVGSDPRVDTTAPLQPYIGFIPGGGAFDDAAISSQSGPMFLMTGGGDTLATRSGHQQPVFDDVNQPVFWGTLANASHLYATGAIGDFRGPATAWFRAQLMGDAAARALFYGASCGLCSDASWTVERKGID